MEEICYYLTHHIDTIEEDVMDASLVTFIRKELGLNERADLLEKLIESNAEIKDIVISILCSADYNTEVEIKLLFEQLDEISRLSPASRKKRYADDCLRHGQSREAMKEYRRLLNIGDASSLTDQEYGGILHNVGVIQAQNGAFYTAAEHFYEAYERNGSKESLRQYLFALKLSNREEEFKQAVDLLVDNKQLVTATEAHYFSVIESTEATEDFVLIQRLNYLKGQGRMAEYNALADEIIGGLKEKYRRNNC